MKRYFALLCSLLMLLILAACAAKQLKEPPQLTVEGSGGSIMAWEGTHSWMWEGKGLLGTGGGVNACSDHPLSCQDSLPRLEEAGAEVTLTFAVPPEKIVEVRCWSDEYWGVSTAVSQKPELQGDTLTLLPGGYIYSVTAAWNDAENAYNGNCVYAFYAVGAE